MWHSSVKLKNWILIFLMSQLYCVKGTFNVNCEHGSLRLINGGSANKGRLEICINFVWGTICDNVYSSDTNNAKVACRQLGYEVDGGQNVTNAYYGHGSGPIWLKYPQCTGIESNLLECPRRYDIGNPYGCSQYEDVSIVCPVNSCTKGDVRLTDGLVPNEGTVEVCYNGAWTSVCDNGWGYQEAFLVCRQLGLPATGAQSLSSNYFGTGHGIPTLNYWRCIGNETNLLDCLYSSDSTCFSSSGVYHRASIRCTGMIASDSCGTSGNMRLVRSNGPNDVEGRVEYCSNGVWGTVSYLGFDVNDGKVVCRKLGYQEPRVLIFRNYGQGSGPVLFIYLHCNENEFTLDDCSFDLDPYWYDHSYDVAVRCMEKVPTDCTHGSIRLVNGSTLHEGRVEICLNGEWGTVCGTYWDRRDAQVVCRQLGYVPTWASFYRSSQFGDGDLQQLIWNVQCSGSETSLLNCSYQYDPSSSCYYGRAAGVKCYNSTYCTEGDIRLVGGNSSNEGDIQICESGVWGFICDYDWHWFWYWYYSANMIVTCRQLGYHSDNNWIATSWYSFFGGNQDIAPIVWDGFNCVGNETSLTQCSKYNYGYYSTCTQSAVIYCADIVNCTNWSVRLVDNEDNNEGKVEICIDGIWMTTEANYWSYSHAKIVCRQLGYYDKWSVAITDIIWKTKSKRVGYQYFGCTGNETSLSNCSYYYDPWYYKGIAYWYDKIRAGVECQMKLQSESCTNVGTIRLSGGSQSNEGRVEICLDGYWGSVCSNGWDEQDALVTCRQAGYQTLRAIPMYDAFFGRGVGPVHMTSVGCHGNENSLIECSYMSGIGVDNCYHGKDIGVICLDSAVFYNVTISLSSDQSSVTIGNKVSLLCNVSPSPPINTTYQWRTTVSGVILSQPIFTYPNVTLTVPTGHTQQGNYYCIVKYNGATLGRGHTQITVKDLLNPVGNKVKSTIIGTNVNLTVSITDSFITDYLRELNWYHNDQQIVNIFNKYSIINDNKTLIITNITKEDVGEYSVKFDGLRLYHYNRDCEQKVLQLLRHYPVLSPTVFYVSIDGDRNDIIKSSAARCSTPTYPVTGFNKTTQKSLVISFLNEDKQYSNEAQVIWYHDGSRVTSGMTSSHLGLYSKPYYSLSINNPTVLHSGYYESQLTVTASTVLSLLSCSNSYQDFLTSSNYLNFSTIVIDSIVQRLEYYETPSVNLTTDKISFNSTSNAELMCSVSGGYPLYYNITLMKNGLSIANIIGSSQLVYNTEEDQTGSKYGVYKCIVNNTVIEIESSVYLKEEAVLTLNFKVDSCHQWNDHHIPAIESAIKEHAQLSCSCSLVNASFKESTQSCSNNILSFSAIFIYAASNGLFTASKIVNKLERDFSQGRNTTLTVNGQQLTVTDNISQKENNNGILTGLFFAGFISATILCGIIIIIVIPLLLKSRKGRMAETTVSQDEVRYTTKPSAVTVASSKPSNQKQPNKSSANTIDNQSSRPKSTSTAQTKPRVATTTQQVKSDKTMATAASVKPKEKEHTYETLTSSLDVDTYEELYR